MTRVEQKKIPSEKKDKTQRVKRVTHGEQRGKIAERSASVTELGRAEGTRGAAFVPSAQGTEQAKRIDRQLQQPARGARREQR